MEDPLLSNSSGQSYATGVAQVTLPRKHPLPGTVNTSFLVNSELFSWLLAVFPFFQRHRARREGAA